MSDPSEAPPLREADVRRHVERLGWSAEPHGPGTLKCVRTTAEGRLNLYARLSEEWLVLSIVPFLSTRGRNSFELGRWLLRMNRDMKQAKFAYDDDGDVVLTVDLPTESLDESEIAGALESLVAYATRHRAILKAASAPRSTG